METIWVSHLPFTSLSDISNRITVYLDVLVQKKYRNFNLSDKVTQPCGFLPNGVLSIGEEYCL